LSEPAANPRVLYIEADRDARIRVSTSLETLGYRVTCVHDGPTAIASFGAGAPDVVLLGLHLVGMEAVEVCRRVKALAVESFLPVIYLTSESEVSEKVRVLEAGGDDFCVEPMRVAELDARIRVLLRMRARELRIVTQSNRFKLIAYVDSLTEVGNRRAFEKTIDHVWRSLDRQEMLALLVVDIDHFKNVNDAHGHAVGDRVLQGVARAIQHAVRKADEVFRFGGEEFVIIAPGVDRAAAVAIGERIREHVSRVTEGDARVSVTVSVGVAVGPGGAFESPRELFLAADRALYEAKTTGRNCVVARGRPVAEPN
jgi:two-component system cell cycle response regulator